MKWNLLKSNYASCKKDAAQSGSSTTPTKYGQGEKVVKSRWRLKNSYDG